MSKRPTPEQIKMGMNHLNLRAMIFGKINVYVRLRRKEEKKEEGGRRVEGRRRRNEGGGRGEELI